MYIPEEVRIGSMYYTVRVTDKDLVANGQHSAATIDYNNHIIEINNKIGDIQQREESFLHELIHGIPRDRSLDIDNEEVIVEELAKGLHQVILDNPEMFEEDIIYLEEGE